MYDQLTLRNVDQCLEVLNGRGDLPCDLYMDFTSGDIWIPEYPQECVYDVQFCDAVSIVHEFPACDIRTYSIDDIKEICQKAYGEYVVVCS